jgi:putative ATPase
VSGTSDADAPALFDVAPPADGAGEKLGSGSLADAVHGAAPLAVRMRPRSLDELVGQAHLRADGSPLRRLVDGDQPMSVLLWGPPGTGKTTIASLVSIQTDRRFVEVSAVSAGVKDVRDAIDSARRLLGRGGRETVLFVDEVHRFSKAQQDALLPGVENRWVSLVAATTENPHFSVISPLLSRSLLLTLQPLTEDDITTLLDRAVSDSRGLDGEVTLQPEARDHLVRLAGGDARRALTYLEAAAGAARSRHDGERAAAVIDVATAALAVDRAAVRYDRQGDQHYDVTSALIKSVRGSDVDAALHYLARMVEAGEDPRFIARRLMIAASEDIGMADPTALSVAASAASSVAVIGWPEARIILAQAVIHLALAPKSNAVVTAIDAAQQDVRAGLAGAVPPALRDAHYSGAKRLGHGHDYRYAHDDPRGVVEQQHAPDEVAGRDYYLPTRRGTEADFADRVVRLRRILRGG